MRRVVDLSICKLLLLRSEFLRVLNHGNQLRNFLTLRRYVNYKNFITRSNIDYQGLFSREKFKNRIETLKSGYADGPRKRMVVNGNALR